MGTLVINRKDIMARLDGDAVAFYTNGQREGLIPIKPLKRVIVCVNAMLESALLGRLAEENISVVFLSGKRQHYRGTLHGKLHNNGLLRLKQYEKALSAFASELARELVTKKLVGHAELLKEVFEARPDRRIPVTKALSVVAGAIESVNCSSDIATDSLRGIEGGAAAAYFSAYTALFPESLDFTKRIRRPPTDPVNALLSLAYTLVHWETVTEIELAGLDPTIGFYHTFDYGRESLACDIVETQRPSVDRWIWRLFAERIFTAKDFTSGDERPGCYLNKNGKRAFYALYAEWAVNMRSVVAKEVGELSKRIMGGENAKGIVS